MSLAQALRTGDISALPSKRDEDWRWTDLRGLLRALPDPAPSTDAALPPGPFAGIGEAEVAVVNGRLRGEASVLDLASGERTVRLRFAALAAAAAQGSHLAIRVGLGARLTLLESYEGLADGYVADTALDIRLEDDAVLERIVIAADDADAVSVSTAEVSLGARAVFTQTLLTDGARRQRLETRLVHPGAHASVRLDGLYILAGKRHADITTLVEHAGVDGETAQLTKGVVRDQARGIFQGRIVVAEGADHTTARMGHHALVLSDRAEVDAKPELEIYADDVACTHGNTIGALDEDALFYIRQRGVPEAEARALLVEAFLGAVIDRIGHEPAREAARAWAADRLEA